MPLVDKAPLNPGCCIITGAHPADAEIFDTGSGTDHVAPWVYLQAQLIRTWATELGMVEGSEYEALKTEIAEKQALLEQFAQNLSDLQQQVAAFETVKEMVSA